MYAIRLADGTWTTRGVISVTGWIKNYIGADRSAFFRSSARRKAKRLNELFRASHDFAYPTELYDILDERDWAASVASAVTRQEPTGEAFRHMLELNADAFVRLPYGSEVDADLRQRFYRWRSGEPEARRTPGWFAECFGEHEPRVVAALPHLTGWDVDALNPRFGTRLHYDIEHYLNGLEPKYTVGTKDWAQFLAFNEEVLKARGHEPFRTELTMSVASIMLCGQLDFLARTSDGRFILYDWKRTATIREDGNDLYLVDAKPMLPPWAHRTDSNRNQYMIQLNVYRQMLKKYGIDVSEMYLVCFHGTLDKYQLIPVSCIAAGDSTPDAVALRTMVRDRAEQVKRLAIQ